MEVELKIPIKTKLWDPPNFVCVGPNNEISMPLKDVPDEVFHELVDAWVVKIYQKAGKRRPAERGGGQEITRHD